MLLVLLLTTLAVLAGWYYTDGRFTTAPALTSLTQDRAAGVARGAGLEVFFEPEFSESVTKGVVISTRPSPGEKVVTGAQIQALVSQGPERYRMPRVVGLTQASAGVALASAHLVPGRVTSLFSDTVAAGLVLRSSPAAGLPLKKQTPVDLTVSAGPRPIKIRDYQRERTSDAQAALKRAGFTVSVTKVHSATIPKGLVISQTPDQGKGRAGDPVSLKSSLGPVMVTVPYVKSMGIVAATTVMREAGFRVKVKPVPVNYLGLGYVSYSRPAARARVPQGSTIILYTV